MMARMRGGVFQTFDINKRHANVPEVVAGTMDNMNFVIADILSGASVVVESIKRPNNFIWFDNGVFSFIVIFVTILP